jgi:hypothetical protein
MLLEHTARGRQSLKLSCVDQVCLQPRPDCLIVQISGTALKLPGITAVARQDRPFPSMTQAIGRMNYTVSLWQGLR